MNDMQSFPSRFNADVQTCIGNSVANGVTWQNWEKPRGKTMAFILCVGRGGNGGTGVIGANSTAAGGGGGGSGGVSRLVIPIMFLPDRLYLSAGNTQGVATYVSIHPSVTTQHLVLHAAAGGAGGNASGATAGAAGAAGGISGITTAPLTGLGVCNFIAGQAGIIGGTTVAAGALTIPFTSVPVTGGTGGGGLPGAGVAGTNGGAFGGYSAPSPFPAHSGGIGAASGTTPAGNGSHGPNYIVPGLNYSFGGTGGGSTHGTATGAGLVQSRGGDGGYGSGGGGMGGALTGSAAGAIGRGGSGYITIVCW